MYFVYIIRYGNNLSLVEGKNNILQIISLHIVMKAIVSGNSTTMTFPVWMHLQLKRLLIINEFMYATILNLT